MGLWGADRERIVVKETQKWDYINLSDYRSKSCGNLTGYIWLWILVIISCAVYVVDTFTAVKLLAFNQWSSQVQPKIPFEISKWIFAGCIILSWVICIYEWIRAYRVMKQHSVTEDYLDPLAVVLQSIRWDGGYSRFLVFAKLTKSKKKATWFALFVYFERKGCLRVLGAEGPRQVVNALTLWSVMSKQILPTGSHSAPRGSSPIIQFFLNIGTLADQDVTQALILSSMAFTLVIWIISMILLFLALIFYIFFLWGYIKNETLTGFCRRKVETRLARIVKAKTDKIWEQQRKKDEEMANKAAKKGGSTAAPTPFGELNRKPTLPVFDTEDDLQKSNASFISKADSTATLPRYTSQPTTPANEYPSRAPSFSSFRTNSTRNYSDGGGSLLGNAAPMPYSQPPILRPGTANSQKSYSSARSGAPSVPPLRTPGSGPAFPPPSIRPSPVSGNGTPVSANSAPWRTPVSPVNENTQEYEMQDGAMLPSALRPALGRREVSSPVSAPGLGPNRGLPYPPQRSFTAPMNTPSNGPFAPQGPPRIGTPGAPLTRSQTPGTMGSERSLTPTGRSAPGYFPPQRGSPPNRPLPPPDPNLGGW